MKKLCLSLFVLSVFFSCKEEVAISFTEFNIEFNENAIIEINVPRFETKNLIGDSINSKIENHIADMLNFSDDKSNLTLGDALEKFDNEYSKFKNDFAESALVWEAMFDGEVTYQSSEVISIAINSYLNTGGAHGNMNITFLNFDPMTGDLLVFEDIISDKIAFSDIAQKHFKIATQTLNETDYEDYFFGENFHLPANIGLNDEGLILFYNVYEIASYAIGITEFTIPYDEVNTYLNVN